MTNPTREPSGPRRHDDNELSQEALQRGKANMERARELNVERRQARGVRLVRIALAKN
jgi:hypothetical protein